MPAKFVGISGGKLLEPACIGTAVFTLCYYPQVWPEWAASSIVGSKSAAVVLSVLLGLRLTRHLNSWLSQQAMNNFCTDAFVPQNEIVLITGGSRGIGAEMAKRFVKAGAKVVILDLISPQYPLSVDGGDNRITYYEADISSAEDIHNVAARVRQEVGDPTVLINNAGIGASQTVLTLDDARLNKIFDVNIIAPFRLVKEFAPAMIERNHGHVVNIASTASFVTIAGNTAYSCTKTGVLAFTEGLRQELKHVSNARKIRVTSVHPTWIRTPLSDHLTKGKKWNMLTLEPEEVADAVTNQVLDSNGGTSILPSRAWSISLSRAYPDWFQEWSRDSKASLMSPKK